MYFFSIGEFGQRVGTQAYFLGTDDPELYDGAHVSLQVVGRRFQEEKVLAITEYLGNALDKQIV